MGRTFEYSSRLSTALTIGENPGVHSNIAIVLGCSGRREWKKTKISDQHFVVKSLSSAVLGIISTSFPLEDMLTKFA